MCACVGVCVHVHACLYVCVHACVRAAARVHARGLATLWESRGKCVGGLWRGVSMERWGAFRHLECPEPVAWPRPQPAVWPHPQETSGCWGGGRLRTSRKAWAAVWGSDSCSQVCWSHRVAMVTGLPVCVCICVYTYTYIHIYISYHISYTYTYPNPTFTNPTFTLQKPIFALNISHVV